jgi:hypothetical protein
MSEDALSAANHGITADDWLNMSQNDQLLRARMCDLSRLPRPLLAERAELAALLVVCSGGRILRYMHYQ